jgi:hypothetical protein
MKRAFFSCSINDFLVANQNELLGLLVKNSDYDVGKNQRDAWIEEISILQSVLNDKKGMIYFEFAIPRMGRRIDVVLLIGSIIFVIEFKVGEREFLLSAKDQVWDYALDLKNFHETSHGLFVVPILFPTQALSSNPRIELTPHNDKLFHPIECCLSSFSKILDEVIEYCDIHEVDQNSWESGRYSPTPTIIEAATALYNGHSVADISRSDASAINLSETSDTISEVIHFSKTNSCKSICFVTGVPGAGKTLIGLNTATTHIDKENDLYSVFLSGNGPLVSILREALARDKVRNGKERGYKIKKSAALSEVKMFIQNVHHFRDDCLFDSTKSPIEHVALFDEAQRAWNLEQTANFMLRKKKTPGFNKSEPEFLISCLDRHPDWAVIVCLVGGGQEINTGEAGISEWVDSLIRSFPKWHIFISPQLSDSEYGAGKILMDIKSRPFVTYKETLHLSVSMRSFRSENVSLLVKQILDLDANNAIDTFKKVCVNYPIVITRELSKAKNWLKQMARGSERFGIIVSSQAERLKPHAIDVKSPMEPIHWFLDGKEDVRSSYYLEDVATEFDVQGLELDWVCVAWDADFRYSNLGWNHWSFSGDRWNRIRKPERQKYQKNAYRVLLTRARQGMVIVVPNGDWSDPTRNPTFYDPTYNYLKNIGIPII